MRDDLERLATTFLDALNNDEMGAIDALVHDDARYVGPEADGEIVGRDGLIGALTRVKTRGSGIIGTADRWTIDVDSSVVIGEISWHNDDLAGAPRIDGFLALTVVDDRIVGLRELHIPRFRAEDDQDCILYAPPERE